MLGSMVGFSRSADRMALFRVGANSTGMCEKIMREESLGWLQCKAFLVEVITCARHAVYIAAVTVQ